MVETDGVTNFVDEDLEDGKARIRKAQRQVSSMSKWISPAAELPLTSG